MSKEAKNGAGRDTEGSHQPGAQRPRWDRLVDWGEGVLIPWGRFLKIFTDPATLILIAVAVVLGWYGVDAIDPEYNGLLQLVIALITGLAGARLSSAYAALTQEGRLLASGRMAVRGLRLILGKTLALERRVSKFVVQGDENVSPEIKAAVAQRNLDEILESIRNLQLEVAGSIENWVDVVPEADVSGIIVAIGELRDQVSQKEDLLKAARESELELQKKGNANEEALRASGARISELESEVRTLNQKMRSLKSAATNIAPVDMFDVKRRNYLDVLSKAPAAGLPDWALPPGPHKGINLATPAHVTESHKLPK